MIERHLAVEPLLADLPAHWTVERLKAVTERQDLRNADLSEPMMSLKSSGEVVLRSSLGQRQEPDDSSLPRYLVARPGNLIVNPMWLIGGAIGVTEMSGAVSPDYRVFELRTHVPRYLHYVLRTTHYVDQYRLYTRAQTTFDRRVQQPDLDNLPLPLPPVDEQQQIADYLDREVAVVDALIAKQERLVRVLRERLANDVRLALIRGIRPGPTLRDSGVAELGEIPMSWKVVPARYLCTITTGSEDSGNATEDGAFPFFVRGRKILQIGHYGFDCEAVMTPGDGQGGVGKVFHYFNGKFEAHQRVYVFKDFKNVAGRYFYLLLSNFLPLVALAGGNKVTMESLRRPMLAGLPLPVPPQEEQAEILAHLDEATAKVDLLIGKTERFIELAKERRTALITAAVTGKIDVREMAA